MEPFGSTSRSRRLPQSGPKRSASRFARVWPLVGARATHMVLGARWAGNLLAVLLLWPSRLATIVSPREFGPALTSYRTHRHTSNFPIDGANCRVAIFGPGPLQWICREWVQKLGSDKATACFEGGKTHRIRRPNSSRIPKASLLFLGLLLPGRPSFVRPLLLYILLLHSSSSYTCRSSMPIPECTSHRPLFLGLYELL